MINQVRRIDNVSREFSSEFIVGECWGYNKFYRIDQLLQDGYWTEHEDKVRSQ